VPAASVIGSGPNGLAAAIVLARAGWRVTVYEAEDLPGGGVRSAQVTLPGFVHDLGSAVHPLALASPFFRTLHLERFGLQWVQPPAPAAHPLDSGTAVVLERGVPATADGLGPDRDAYTRLFARLVRDWVSIFSDLVGPPRLPRHPVAALRFGLSALHSARSLADAYFRGERARALFAGLAAHSLLPLEMRPSAAFGLILGISGHAVGWPFPRGGAQALTNALIECLRSLGGTLVTRRRIHSLEELDGSRLTLCDVPPRRFMALAGDRLPEYFRRKLDKFQHGPGAFKVDWALDGPIPWRAPECARAGTVHLGGTLEEIAESERAPCEGAVPQRPYVLLAQPSLFDPTRAPSGRHTAWAYCHVPNGCNTDMVDRMELQVERFAPGFRSRILARHVMPPAALERANSNLVGGDINGGAVRLSQMFLRPTVLLYSTPLRGVYFCSASTPPGGGVHGLCGYYAARRALRDVTDPTDREPAAGLSL
jgi:phytoene dehydrogenase-like protein